MFNPFNFGHALPLRFRRFLCCARLHAKRRVCGAVSGISRYNPRRMFCEHHMRSDILARCDASLIADAASRAALALPTVVLQP